MLRLKKESQRKDLRSKRVGRKYLQTQKKINRIPWSEGGRSPKVPMAKETDLVRRER